MYKFRSVPPTLQFITQYKGHFKNTEDVSRTCFQNLCSVNTATNWRQQ